MKRRFLVLYVLFWVLLLTACHRPQPASDESAPLMRLAVTSATHIGYLSELGMLDRVVAVTNRSQIYTPLPDGVLDLGDAVSPNMEILLLANADAVLVCEYAGSSISQQLERLGIRAIPIDDWKEKTPLARAEWIKRFGELLGCEERADSVYRSVEERYMCLASNHDMHSSFPPKVLPGANFRGTWYVPSGASYMGQFFRDAGFAYPFYDDTREGSIPMTFESCLMQFSDADIWIGADARSLRELAAIDEKHTWFRPYKTGRVYNWLRQTTNTGANNFWERGVVHPEEILEDLIHIMDESPDSLHFAEKLK